MLTNVLLIIVVVWCIAFSGSMYYMHKRQTEEINAIAKENIVTHDKLLGELRDNKEMLGDIMKDKQQIANQEKLIQDLQARVPTEEVQDTISIINEWMNGGE